LSYVHEAATDLLRGRLLKVISMTATPRKKIHPPRKLASGTSPPARDKATRAERTAQLAGLFGGSSDPERIAKKMARAGLCSRRDAEAWISEGRVAINGKTLTSPAINVGEGDVVTVDGRPLAKEDIPRLWRYYKPRGLVVSNRDEKGRKTVFDVLPEHLPRVVSVGRLDLDSEGLLLLTNSGDLARVLELPETGWTRKYRVRVRGRIDQEKLDALADGITIEGVRYRGIQAKLDRQSTSNAWLTIALKEGKNREIRNVMSHLGYTVSRLIRVGYGPFQLKDMDEGAVEEVKTSVLRDQLGLPRDVKKPARGAGGNRRANHQRKKPRHPS
jgi:23S rRNA pseudouridine2605 synthase